MYVSTGSNRTMTVRDHIKQKILIEHIEVGFINDVKNGIRDRNCYNTAGKAFETLSKIFIAFGGILSFSSGYFSNPHLSFAAGSVSTVSLAFLQFSTFCYKESMKNQENVNTILRDLEIQNLPDQQFHQTDSKESHTPHRRHSHLEHSEEEKHQVRVHMQQDEE
jgi:hypothetical protein